MLRISQLKLPVGHTEEELQRKIQKALHVPEAGVQNISVRKQSLDARHKPELFYVYTVDVKVPDEAAVLKRLQKKKAAANVTCCTEKAYVFPAIGKKEAGARPVIIGCGPAGLFCAYFLAQAGYCPVLLEQGAPVEERQKDVEAFWKTGVLNPDSNVQFGEGGAGTFSDGKLNTLIKDPVGRNRKVLEVFVENGAPEEILYVHKPHIGTDVLRDVIRRMREKIQSLGGELHFHTRMTEILTDEAGTRIRGIRWERTDTKETGERETGTLVLAPGHSARETFRMLYEKAVPMEAKSFAVGVRAEHPQKLINHAQYGDVQEGLLPAAAYKLTEKLPEGRGVYSFCMCPGGYVVNASSEEGLLAVNGMSYHARDSRNANSAIVVTVTPEDFGAAHPLAGIEFQRRLERAAYQAGKGKIPVQRYGDFYRSVTGKEKEPENAGDFAGHMPCMRGEYASADLSGIFPADINQSLVAGMEKFSHKIRGFSHPDTLLSAVESRTSSPVRILRDGDTLESRIAGLYPCGEGAGYAGGITSAAVDGIKIAEIICKNYAPFDREKGGLRKK